MACGCVDNSCACVVTGGSGVVVSGNGSAANPFVVSSAGGADPAWTGINTDGGITVTPGGVNGHSPVINLNLDPASPAVLSVGVNGLSVACCASISPIAILDVDSTLDSSNELVLVDNTLNPITIMLPATPNAGANLIIVDYGNSGAGNSTANNITVDPNGNNISTSPSNYILNLDGVFVKLVFDGIDNWIQL
jgi:hypothetical protein